MTLFDSIVVGNDLLSEHWLSEPFTARVKAMRPGWAEREQHKPTPRRGLAGLGATLGSTLRRARETGREEDLRAAHREVVEALGLRRDPAAWTSTRLDEPLEAPNAIEHHGPTGPQLLVLEACDAAGVEDLLDADGAGRLLDPVVVDGAAVTSTAAALSALFDAEHAPPLVLVVAGGWVLLAERGAWPEGRWLGVDVATVADRHDMTAAGEVETTVALVSADALLVDAQGETPFLGYLADSVKHAVGVSEDLRVGLRVSVELIATEVLARRRARGLPDDAVADIAGLLTRQSLRFLYRILFLLYAEARPELGVLPVGTPEYAEGYGLDRLRDLVVTEPVTERARTGTHLFESLATLFRVVDRGRGSTGDDDGGGLVFEALRADLFQPAAIALIDQVGLGNACLQRVLHKLLLSEGTKKRDAGYVSYAQLGINQLGAAYEGLMAYGGSLATQTLYEVARHGDRTKGSWVVPADRVGDYDPSWFVTADNDETGVRSRRTYAPGDFVFVLSGRQRQRSASYYTPEVLTRCVVTHSLAELLSDDDPASRVLDLTICEPALGSGAFLVEAVRQLGEEYLRRREAEVGRKIDPEQRPAELQKVKAHLALHCCYGVDLNATAVELAEISLWLAAMHSGLRGPWFGLHLRRGNSLIGGRREVYAPAALETKAWLTTVPTARPLSESVADGEVHHFLVPAQGWGAVADTKEARELAKPAVDALKAWRKGVRAAPTPTERRRLAVLAQRVERLWEHARRRLTIAEQEVRRPIAVWEATVEPGSGAVSREQIEAALADDDGAYRRLRRVMDAWAALWFWPVTTDVAPPTWARWLSGLEGLLGSRADTAPSELFAADPSWDDLGDAEQVDGSFAGWRAVSSVLDEHPWLRVCADIAEREGFFHWELDFAPVFADRGGFDLQLGNPPWVRPDWDDTLVLADVDPWFALADKPAVATVAARRGRVVRARSRWYLDERASLAGLSEHLGSDVDRPVLAGLQPDLYRCFMDRTWRGMNADGIVGLIHPESHFTEGRAGTLRSETYRRLRRHWQFRNELSLFEIHHTRQYGVQVYGIPRHPTFLSASSLYEPETLERSLRHDGTGAEPGIKDDDDRWDIRPHTSRLVPVGERVLATWATLIDEPGTPPSNARMLRPVTISSQRVLEKLAAAPRFSELSFQWTSGWHESADKSTGYFVNGSEVPETLEDVILQGPHLSVATPYARQPNSTMRNNLDYADWNLETLPRRALPRTSYQRAKPVEEYEAGYPRWSGESSRDAWRIAWRRMADSNMVRTLHAALLPAGPTHIHGLLTATTLSLDLAIAAGLWSSIPVDFFVKASGASELNQSIVSRFPHPRDHVLVPEVIQRALRLNCLTAYYAPLWEELFDPAWQQDRWTRELPALPMGAVEKSWTMSTPLRRDAERRQALVEIDGLAAVMLGISAEELCAIYRTQFGVLRKYERVMQFDANGRQVPRDVLKAHEKQGARADLGRYQLPFTGVDREKEMTIAHEEFSRRASTRQTSNSGGDAIEG